MQTLKFKVFIKFINPSTNIQTFICSFSGTMKTSVKVLLSSQIIEKSLKEKLSVKLKIKFDKKLINKNSLKLKMDVYLPKHFVKMSY